MPGATDTEFFARADMLDTDIGQDPGKADPAKVARDGWDAMMAGKGARAISCRGGRTRRRSPPPGSCRNPCSRSSIARWPSRAAGTIH